MGWFNFKLSSHEETKADLILYAPITGTIVPLEDVPDVVFSEKIVGEGIAIKPSGDKVVAPCNCTILEIFETNHAIVVKTIPDDLIIFIHVGIDTVELKGEGFFRAVEEGDTVKTGDTLIDLNLNLIQNKAKSTVTPVLISSTQQNRIAKIEKMTNNCINGSSPIMKITFKKDDELEDSAERTTEYPNLANIDTHEFNI